MKCNYNLIESKPYDASESKNESKNKKRKKEAIKFIRKNMVLNDFIMERYFANYFLSSFFKYSYNIDAILYKKVEHSFDIYETKFKYPTKDGHFGMNYGQALFFIYLLKNGFNNLKHYILYKNKNSKSYSIIDFINDNKPHKWYYKCINNNEITNKLDNIKDAPSETSITSRKTQNYIKFSIENFNKLTR